MTKKNTQTTETSCKTTGSGWTSVRTIYARAAVLLLAVNFCLTGYVVLNMNKTQQEQIDSLSQNVPAQTSKATRTLGREAAPSRSETTDSGHEPTTRENQ